MKSKLSPWRIAVLGILLVAMSVCSTAVAQQDGPRPKTDQDRMEGRRGQGDMRGMARMMMPPPAPVMLIEGQRLYILSGDVLYKFDTQPLEQMEAGRLMPPPPPPGMMGPPPPPPAP